WAESVARRRPGARARARSALAGRPSQGSGRSTRRPSSRRPSYQRRFNVGSGTLPELPGTAGRSPPPDAFVGFVSSTQVPVIVHVGRGIAAALRKARRQKQPRESRGPRALKGDKVMKTHGYTYQATLAASERIHWRVEDLIGDDKRLDFSKPFMPESLARVESLSSLRLGERLALNQIRGLGYLYMFGLVEEFILP